MGQPTVPRTCAAVAILALGVLAPSSSGQSVLHAFHATWKWASMGTSVSTAGDVNGDGYADVIVGVPGAYPKQVGNAQVFSGLDGSRLYLFVGDAPGTRFGASVSGAGDVNGDGVPDLIVGAPWDDDKGSKSGSARVLSGADGSTLYTLAGETSSDWFGSSVSGAGDVNGDGFDDLIVGEPYDSALYYMAGGARIFSGLDGSVLYTFDGDSYAGLLGTSVSGAGDVDGDGFADVIIGAPSDQHNGVQSGSARIFSGRGYLGTNYCGPVNLNSTGQSAVIQASGSQVVAEGYFTLQATVLPPGQPGYFLASQAQGFTPFLGGGQGNLCLGGQLGRFRKQIQHSGSDGSFSLHLALTHMPPPGVAVQPGETWYFQAWFRDQNPTATSNFTDGLSITFR